MLPAVRLLTFCIVLAFVAPADAGPRRGGKVVRVERARTGPRGVPRACQILAERGTGNCWGRGPVKGEHAVVVDGNGYHGVIEIREVTERNDNSCGTPQFWEYRFDVVEGDLKGTQDYGTWALIDVDVTPRIKMLDPGSIKSPSGKDGEQPYAVFDRDGNGDGTDSGNGADFAVVAFPCQPDTGAPMRVAQAGYCMDYWMQPRGGQWALARRDVVQICTP